MKSSKVSRLLSLIIILMLVSCSSAIKQSDLIGKWTEDDSKIVVGLPVKSIEFFADGKVMIGDQYPGTFKLMENGELQVTVQGEVYQDPIKINGKTLTITQDDGDSKNYTKK